MSIYEGVIEPTALYGTEASGMRSDERREMNILDIKCLSVVLLECHEWIEFGMKRMQWRAGIERELPSRADQRVLRWFEHVENG